MKTKKILIIILFFSLASFSELQGEMSADKLGVNHQTKECASFISGDECSTCSLPVGYIEAENCPAGYTNNTSTTRYDLICTAKKGGFCCSESHSGSSGDCEDVVVNNKTKECGLVEDIYACESLQTGWERAPQHVWNERYCPSTYKWKKDFSCQTGSNNTGSNNTGSNDDNKFSEVFQRDLKVGDSGEDVKVLQQILNATGYKIVENGSGSKGNETTYFGLLTQKALIKFQIKNNVYPSQGYFGPKTRSAIFKITQLYGE